MSKKGVILGAGVFLLSCLTTTPAFAGTWQHDGYHWSYYNDSAQIVTGWVKDGDKWYFLYDNGIMAADTWIDNYSVNRSGVWTQTR